MQFPNKVYISEYKEENKEHFVIVVVASNLQVAREYVKKQIGIDVKPTWLMNAVYPTIYTSDGSKPAQLQTKILYNGNFQVYNYKK